MISGGADRIAPVIELRFDGSLMILDDGVTIVRRGCIEAAAPRRRRMRRDVKAAQDSDYEHEQVLRIMLSGSHFIDTRYSDSCYDRLVAWLKEESA